MISKATAKDWAFKAFIAFSIVFIPSLLAHRFFIAKNECESSVRAFYDLRLTNPPADVLKKSEDLMYKKCGEEGKNADGYLRMYDAMHKPRPKPFSY